MLGAGLIQENWSVRRAFRDKSLRKETVNRSWEPNITVWGVGTVEFPSLKSLCEKDVEIAAIVTVADDGGSSGEFRKNMQQFSPPGVIFVMSLAPSDMPKFYEKVFQYLGSLRMVAPLLAILGNLIIAGLSEMQGSIYNAMQLLSANFHIQQGKFILPVTILWPFMQSFRGIQKWLESYIV